MENITAILIGGIIVLFIIGSIIYLILRFLRGKLKITLSKTAFNSGEKVSGSIELLTKKQIEGNRLFVSLIGKEITRYNQGGKSRTQSREIFRNEVNLEDARTFQAGEQKQYTFEIDTPDPKTESDNDSPLGEMLKTGLEILSRRHTYLKWYINARLDAKGVDLSDSENISINL